MQNVVRAIIDLVYKAARCLHKDEVYHVTAFWSLIAADIHHCDAIDSASCGSVAGQSVHEP